MTQVTSATLSQPNAVTRKAVAIPDEIWGEFRAYCLRTNIAVPVAATQAIQDYLKKVSRRPRQHKAA
ncbi:MAG TPA: hypothetical protein VG273_11975 [Bryobacteraceae bacterium]|nr:hypothetical protein [Bryobacteraceae bacterium]